MSIGLGAQNSGDDELSLGEHLAEHAHEGNGTTLTKVHTGLAKIGVGGIVDSSGEPLLHLGGSPASALLEDGASDLCAIRGVLAKQKQKQK